MVVNTLETIFITVIKINGQKAFRTQNLGCFIVKERKKHCNNMLLISNMFFFFSNQSHAFNKKAEKGI